MVQVMAPTQHPKVYSVLWRQIKRLTSRDFTTGYNRDQCN
jgi:hypothetical protein